MKISILTVFPEIHETFLKTSLVGRAVQAGLVEFNLIKFSSFVEVKERIDEPTCGPGAGMIIKPEVVDAAIEHAEKQWGKGYKIFFSPQGTQLTQPVVRQLAFTLAPFDQLRASAINIQPSSGAHGEPVEPLERPNHLILICPRYEGMDERVQTYYADLVLSIGDYVLMGGDLPAQVLLEGLLRFLGVVGKQESVEHDSFSGPFLDYPEYGLPVEWKEKTIPDIVRGGNHGAIQAWRQEQATQKTVLNRFDWFRAAQPSAQDIALAQKHIPNHYVALMHTEVKLKDGLIGNTSIVSLDLHDTARSCATYGIKNFFMVTPLTDQQAIMQTFLDFWNSQEGQDYNPSRYVAVSRVKPAEHLAQVIQEITQIEGKAPLVITTSAKQHEHGSKIDFYSQGTVWKHNRPVLLLFGTGQGLADHVVQKSDFLLAPVSGMTDYKHLSVRSAIAIILDRWLGLQPKL